MGWNGIKAWVAGEKVRASDFVTYLNDNIAYLFERPGDAHRVNEASDYSTSSTTFVDVDATDLALTITTAGGDVLVGFTGTVSNSANRATLFDLAVDGVRQGGDSGIVATSASNDDYESIGFVWPVTGLAAGSHTFKLQWRVSSGTSKLFAGAGTVHGVNNLPADLHPQFFVKEF